MRPTMGCDKVGNPRTFELKPREKLPAHHRLGSIRTILCGQPRPSEPASDKKGGAGSEGSDKGEEGKMIEGAWIIVVAVVAFATIVGVVLLVSEKLYDPNRSRQ